MFSELRQMWDKVKNFNFRDVLLTKKTRDECIITVNDSPVMSEPGAYTDLRKSFDHVLFAGRTGALKFEGIGKVALYSGENIDDNGLIHNIGGTIKMPGIISPFFNVSGKNILFGLNIKPHELISINTGIQRKFDVHKNTEDVLKSSLSIKHPSVALDAKIELSQNNPGLMGLNVKVSSVFYHKLKNVGVLVGFDFARNYSYFSYWKNIFRAFSIGLIFPKNKIFRAAIESSDCINTFNSYCKINDSLEVASSFNLNWSDYIKMSLPNQRWNGLASRYSPWRYNEIGLKYNYSENMSVGIKSNYTGDIITAGAWLSTLCIVTKVL